MPVKLTELGVECRPERPAGRPGLFDALEVGVAWKLARSGFEGMRYAGHRSGGAGRPGLAAPWKVGCAPANVVRGMQMRVEELAARLGKLAVRQQTLSAQK